MKCPECLGKGRVLCPVCNGSRRDPRNINKDCGHCNGKGHVECPLCGSRGTVPDDFKNL